MDDEQLRLLIDACRPASDDLSLPEMAELARRVESDPAVRAVYERSQQWDASLSAAFHDVSAPDLLKQNLLAAVADNAASACPAAHDASAVDEPAIDSRSRRRFNRRTLGVCLGIGVAAAVVLAFMLTRSRQMSAEDIATQTPGWIEALSADGWRDPLAAPPPDEISTGLGRVQLGLAVDRWQPVDFPGARGAAFIDSQRRSVPAVLLVLKSSGRTSLPARPPAAPYSQTGGWQVGAWHADGLVYVLAVQGSRQEYLKVALPRGNIVIWPWAPDDVS